MQPSNATSPKAAFVVTQKSGINLTDFEDVKLYKQVPVVAPVTSVPDALARLGNNHERLLEILTSGIQAEATEKARNESDGWFLYDAEGNETKETFGGSLAKNEIVNPAVLQIAKSAFGYDEAPDSDSKRAAKQAARDLIKATPAMVEGLRKKSALAGA